MTPTAFTGIVVLTLPPGTAFPGTFRPLPRKPR